MAIVAVVLLALLLAGPRLEVLDFHAAGVVLAVLVLVAVVTLRVRAPGWLVIVIAASLPAGIYGSGVLILAPFSSFEFLYIYATSVLYALSAGGVVSIYQLAFRDLWAPRIVKHSILVWAFVAATAILFVFLADFRAFIGAYWDMHKNAHWAISGYRAYDIVSGGGFNGAFGYVMMKFMVLICGKQSGLSRSAVWAFSILFILAGLMMARSYLVLLAVGGLGAAALLAARSIMAGHIVIVGRHVRIFVASLLLTAVAVTGLLEILPDDARSWAFEFVDPEGGIQEVGSAQTIFGNMYFVPASEKSLILGEGYLGRWEGFPYIPSDVGYVRVIHGVGILGSVLFWGPFVVLLVISSRSFVYKDCPVSLLTFIFALVLIAGNFKEFTVFPRSAGVLCLLILALYFSSSKEPVLCKNSRQSYTRPK